MRIENFRGAENPMMTFSLADRRGLPRLLAVVLLGSAASLFASRALADEEAKEPAKETPKIEIALDTSDAPEMAEWAEKAKKTCEDFYPKIVAVLDSEGYKPPKATKITFKKMNGVAYSSGGEITCAAKWFTDHPDDVGAVIHELCHVVQQYHKKNPPGWVVEGIADHVRWFQFEPAERHPRVRNLQKAKYTDSYQTTAAFFDWIVKNKDPKFVTELNAASREGKYKKDIFEKLAGKPLDELWKEFVESQAKGK